MIISTINEYDELKSVLVGGVDNFAWPTDDEEFNNIIKRSKSEAKSYKGPIDKVVLREASEDLEKFSEVLREIGIEVFRPKTNTTNWAYSARDIILTVGNTVIECPTPFSSRSKELDLYPFLKQADCHVIRAPRPQTINDPMFDAANVLKCNDKLVYLLSHSANEAGADWLQEQVGSEFEVIKWQAVQHQITHIDSTLLSCGERTIIANADRLTVESLPDFMKDYKIIWVKDCVPRKFHQFPLASKWIGMNMLTINPDTIIVDEIQYDLIEQLKIEKFKVIPLPMRQSRTLGGGFHCVTCDLHRS